MTRLILRDWEAEAWHAGRLSAVVRLVKPQPPTIESVVKKSGIDFGWIEPKKPGRPWRVNGPVWAVRELMGREPDIYCPLGPPGQRLWIAETWGVAFIDGVGFPTVYKADGERDMDVMEDGRWKSPAIMPQSASRSTAVHLGSRLVRVQTLADSDDECVVRGAYDHGQAAWHANVWVWLHRIGME